MNTLKTDCNVIIDKYSRNEGLLYERVIAFISSMRNHTFQRDDQEVLADNIFSAFLFDPVKKTKPVMIGRVRKMIDQPIDKDVLVELWDNCDTELSLNEIFSGEVEEASGESIVNANTLSFQPIGTKIYSKPAKFKNSDIQGLYEFLKKQ